MSRRPRTFLASLFVLTMFVPLAAQGRPTDSVNNRKLPPVNVTPPQAFGTPTVGSTLSTSPGSWSGTGISFDYQWYRCSATTCTAVAGATSAVYTLLPDDLGSLVFDLVTATNRYGSTTAATQRILVLAAPPVPPAAPGVLTAPSISGTAQAGQSLSSSTGTWSGSPTGYAYQWLRCDSSGGSCAATGSGSSTYVLGTGDVGHTIRVTVTATNAGGSTPSTASATAVVAAAPVIAPTVTITSPTAGATISGNITFAASVSGGTPARVELSIDAGTPYVETAAPYVYNGDGNTLDTTTLANGHHTLSAKVVMSDGTSATSSATVDVENQAPTAPPSSSALPTGNPWVADGLANLEIGKTVGRQVAIRFRADQDGTVSSARIYLIFRALGYYAGDGGQVRCELQADAGGLPSGVALAGATITDPMAAGSFRTFSLGGPVTAGHLYYLVFTNPAPDPVSNYVSLDDLSDAGGDAQPDSDLAILWKYDGGTAWAVNTHHTPIAQITYSGGHTQGQGYVDALSLSGLVNVQGTSVAQEVITPAQSQTVGAVTIRVRKTGAPGPLTVTLGGVSGSVPASAVSAGYGWVRVPLSVSLPAGQKQTLTISAPAGDAYQMFPYQKGGAYGFTAGVFGDGYFVSGSRTDLDLPFYLSP
jgi:hypothetical protein